MDIDFGPYRDRLYYVVRVFGVEQGLAVIGGGAIRTVVSDGGRAAAQVKLPQITLQVARINSKDCFWLDRIENDGRRCQAVRLAVGARGQAFTRIELDNGIEF